METQDSNDEDLNKRIEDQIDIVESDSDGENFFDNNDNFTVTARNRVTNENLGDLISSYKGFQDENDDRDLIVSHHFGNDFIRYFDKEIQTDNHKRFSYEQEDEKYNTSIQDYSMDFKIEEIARNNESINASSILNPKKKKDALEEYFKMTVLAMKIAHKDLDSV